MQHKFRKLLNTDLTDFHGLRGLARGKSAKSVFTLHILASFVCRGLYRGFL
ncbi:MAG: hypothetical protein FWG87_13495 [Defluviitaleaceae bacterium]|nr:hypothetical protein [Defluviitaleaceae bacterium]